LIFGETRWKAIRKIDLQGQQLTESGRRTKTEVRKAVIDAVSRLQLQGEKITVVNVANVLRRNPKGQSDGTSKNSPNRTIPFSRSSRDPVTHSSRLSRKNNFRCGYSELNLGDFGSEESRATGCTSTVAGVSFQKR